MGCMTIVVLCWEIVSKLYGELVFEMSNLSRIVN